MHDTSTPDTAVFTGILQELTLAATDLLEPENPLDAFLDRLARRLGCAGAALMERDFASGGARLAASAGLAAAARARGIPGEWRELPASLPYPELGEDGWTFAIRSEEGESRFEFLLILGFAAGARPPAAYRPLVQGLAGLLQKALAFRRRYLTVREGQRTLIEATPGGIARVAPDGAILELNPFGARLLGLGAVPVPGAFSLPELMIPSDRERYRAVFAEILTGRTPGVTQFLFDVPVADSGGEAGGKRALEAHAVPFRDAEGRISSVLAVIHDVTERRQLQARLFHAERMSAMGVLAAGVAHEINNPLTYVIANLELANERIAEVPTAEPLPASALAEIQKMLEESAQGADRVRNIVKDLKVFSHAQDEVPGEVELAAVLETSLKLARNDLEHRARIVRTWGPLPKVHGSERKLAQVFVNLLLNAAQSIPEGAPDRNTIQVSAKVDETGRVAIEVRDTGRGIPKEIIPRIFDPFFTTKGVGGGTGLGLSICHGIILAFGGEIVVDSEVGQGTAFTVYLRPVSAPAQASLPPEEPIRRSLDVLIVDRDPKLAQALRRTLRKDDQILYASDPAEARSRLAEKPRIDLVFCDLSAPEGFEKKAMMEFTDQAIRLRPELSGRFVFMTGGDPAPEEDRFLEAARGLGNRILEKPFDPGMVRNLLRKGARPTAPAPTPAE